MASVQSDLPGLLVPPCHSGALARNHLDLPSHTILGISHLGHNSRHRDCSRVGMPGWNAEGNKEARAFASSLGSIDLLTSRPLKSQHNIAKLISLSR